MASFTNGQNLPIVYEADPFFAFHHINAFEEDGQIVVDVVAYDDGKVRDMFPLQVVGTKAWPY